MGLLFSKLFWSIHQDIGDHQKSLSDMIAFVSFLMKEDNYGHSGEGNLGQRLRRTGFSLCSVIVLCQPYLTVQNKNDFKKIY